MRNRQDSAISGKRMIAVFLTDNSTIMDMSVAFSSPSANPFADPQTPTKSRGTNGEQATPTSLVRNIFARSRGSPFATPSNQTPRISPHTPSKTPAIVLPNTKRSLAKWSLSPVQPSPLDKQQREEDEGPQSPTRSASKPELLEIKARNVEDIEFIPPNAQPTPPATRVPPKMPHTPSLQVSATLINTQLNTYDPTHAPTRAPTQPASTLPPLADAPLNGRPKKRVRLSSPSQPEHRVVPTPPLTGLSGQSGGTSTSVVSTNSGPDLAPAAWTFGDPPPSLRQVVETMADYGLDTVEYREPFYSDPTDIPPVPKLFAGRQFKVKGNGVADIPQFESELPAAATGWLKSKAFELARSQTGWEFAAPPPTLRQVLSYCEKEDATAVAASQLAVPTQKNRFGFKLSQKKPQREQQNMSVLLLEVFAPSRLHFLPDPKQDDIVAVFFCFQNDRADLPNTTRFPGYHAGYVVVDSVQTANGRAKIEGVPCHYVDSELDLINWVIDAVKDWDPDVLAGWELHNASWGYLQARAYEEFGRLIDWNQADSKPSTCPIQSRDLFRLLGEEIARTPTRRTTRRRSRSPVAMCSTFGVSCVAR